MLKQNKMYKDEPVSAGSSAILCLEKSNVCDNDRLKNNTKRFLTGFILEIVN